jgi:two-component system, chemotaxis family, response regulator Rcp1
MSETKTYRILLIEDNPADAELLKIAFSECRDARLTIDVLADSTRLTHYLHGKGEFTRVEMPDLIVLDYHHPVNGGVALAQIGGSPDLMHIPVIVITGSDDPDTVYEAYARHANCVLKKPCDLNELIDLACELARFWFRKAVLPVRRAASEPSRSQL